MRYTILVTIVLLSLVPIGILAGPGGPASIETLKETADLIIVGSVNERMALRVNRVLKGDVSPGTLLDVEWDSPDDVGSIIGQQKLEGLWFLKNTGRGTWLPLSTATGVQHVGGRFFPAILGPISTKFAYDSSTPIIERIAMELGAVADARDGVGFDFCAAMLEGFKSTRSPAVVRMFEGFADSQSRRLKVLGLAALIQRSRSDALAKLEAQLQDFSQLPEMSLAVTSIFMYYQNPDLVSTGALARLAKTGTPVPRLQSSAAHALRLLASRETLPHFAKLLDSPDALVRYEAVCGFATFTQVGDEPIVERIKRGPHILSQPQGQFATADTIAHYPSLSGFQADEGRYEHFWKNWWSENKSKLGLY